MSNVEAAGKYRLPAPPQSVDDEIGPPFILMGDHLNK